MLNILQDWNANKANLKGRIIMICFRISNLGRVNRIVFLLLIPYIVFYRLFIEWFLGTEIPWNTTIGRNFVIYHGQSIVINGNTVIGDNCIIRNCTTIGNKQQADGTYSKSPVIGNNVDIGANVCIIGGVTIGSNVTIGAGTVVVKNVPSGSKIVGNPSRIIGASLIET